MAAGKFMLARAYFLKEGRTYLQRKKGKRKKG